MNEDEIKRSLELLRARRQSLGELREYKPQRGKRSSSVREPEKDVEETFADLLKPAVEE